MVIKILLKKVIHARDEKMLEELFWAWKEVECRATLGFVYFIIAGYEG